MRGSYKLPQTDSIKELAQFWATHDLTDFEGELEEVAEPVFDREGGGAVMVLRLDPVELEAVKRIAHVQGRGHDEMLRDWVLEKLQEASEDLQSKSR